MNAGAVTPAGVRIRDVVRLVVHDVAPDESELFDVVSKGDDARVLRRLKRRRRHGPLEFGVTGVEVLVAPVVWLALDDARKRLADAVVGGTASGIARLVRRMLRRPAAPARMPPLTRMQERFVWRYVLDAAKQAKLSDERATEIANAVLAHLALGEPDPPNAADGSDDSDRDVA